MTITVASKINLPSPLVIGSARRSVIAEFSNTVVRLSLLLLMLLPPCPSPSNSLNDGAAKQLLTCDAPAFVVGMYKYSEYSYKPSKSMYGWFHPRTDFRWFS